MTALRTMAEVMVANERAGQFWFSPSTMRWFQSRVESELIDGRYFVTSEQQPMGYEDDEPHPRLFTVRVVSDKGAHIETVGEFQQHATMDDALAAIDTLTEKAGDKS